MKLQGNTIFIPGGGSGFGRGVTDPTSVLGSVALAVSALNCSTKAALHSYFLHLRWQLLLLQCAQYLEMSRNK
jgi:short-subunit dehydrogenase involved in D-alanine esterification of teichoic acids